MYRAHQLHFNGKFALVVINFDSTNCLSYLKQNSKPRKPNFNVQFERVIGLSIYHLNEPFFVGMHRNHRIGYPGSNNIWNKVRHQRMLKWKNTFIVIQISKHYKFISNVCLIEFSFGSVPVRHNSMTLLRPCLCKFLQDLHFSISKMSRI